MRLWQTRRHWDRFARTDPFWAVLSEPDKQGNRWKIEEFFATGQKDVDTELNAILARYPQLPRRRALDFGCGVGRLTQALANHFDHVTGVDISTEMLALARQYNRQGNRVSYIHNTHPHLELFADGSFDFVYSLITLQHIAPVHAKRYMAEFMRILAPGGAAFFQVPDRRTAPVKRRLSLYPPTVAKKVRRFLNWFVIWEPAMEMNVIPKDEVLTVQHAAGGEVLSLTRHDDAGQDFVSYAYLVRKAAPPGTMGVTNSIGADRK